MIKKMLCRAKQLEETGLWVYGYFCYSPKDDMPAIQRYDCHDILTVDENTLGLYSGFNDKNQKNIFTGDIVHITSDVFECDFVGEVVFLNDGIFSVAQRETGYVKPLANYIIAVDIEVIGNVFDNPDLMKIKEWRYDANANKLRCD